MDKIIEYLLKNGVKPDDLESVKVALAEEQRKIDARKAAEEQRKASVKAAYDNLYKAWVEYLALAVPGAKDHIKETLDAAVGFYREYIMREKARPEKRGVRETYDSADHRWKRHVMSDDEIDEIFNKLFKNW